MNISWAARPRNHQNTSACCFCGAQGGRGTGAVHCALVGQKRPHANFVRERNGRFVRRIVGISAGEGSLNVPYATSTGRHGLPSPFDSVDGVGDGRRAGAGPAERSAKTRDDDRAIGWQFHAVYRRGVRRATERLSKGASSTVARRRASGTADCGEMLVKLRSRAGSRLASITQGVSGAGASPAACARLTSPRKTWAV
jgi:hypothetical protein